MNRTVLQFFYVSLRRLRASVVELFRVMLTTETLRLL